MGMIQILPLFSDWSLLVIRLVVGVIFLAHGWPKIKNLRQNAINFGMMGFKPGAFWGTIVAFAETFGALSILLGLFSSWAALALAVDMIVATLWRIKNGHKLVNGYELDLILMASAFAISALGPGMYSLASYLSW